MINIIEKDNASGYLHCKVSEKVTKEEIQQVAGIVNEMTEDGKKLRLVCEMSEFHGYTIPAFFEDMKFGLTHANVFTHMACIGDNKIEEMLVNSAKIFMKGEIKYFDISKREEAIDWVKQLAKV